MTREEAFRTIDGVLWGQYVTRPTAPDCKGIARRVCVDEEEP